MVRFILGLVVLSAFTAHAQCKTDDECGADEHCGEHQKQSRWVGVCLPGARIVADGPAPLATNHGPMRFAYDGTVPSNFTLHSRPNLAFLLPGIGVFAASYALSQLWLVFLQWNAWSLVPLVGPLTQYFTTRSDVAVEFNVAIIGTVGQALGLAALTIGLVKPFRWLERSSVAIVPTPTGAAVLGSF